MGEAEVALLQPVAAALEPAIAAAEVSATDAKAVLAWLAVGIPLALGFWAL